MINENNKRIAKNTLMLYFRMLFSLGVSLYTSRIVIQVLGVEDYGIYNLVAGVVVLFSFISNAMTTGTQRFLSFEIGKKNTKELKRIFSASLTIYVVITILFFVLAETIGLWFINNQLNIDDRRMADVNMIYHISVVTFIIGIVRLPYDSMILAYEKMSFYAYVSIFEVILKLSVVIILQFYFYDKLILYAFLLMCVSIITFLIYKLYCSKSFEVVNYRLFFDKALYSKLISFAGLRLLGSTSQMAEKQGTNIILNIYIGIVANAAMGIANQVANVLNMFVVNFQLAFNPQIVKYYAVGENKSLEKLVYSSSKISFYLFFLLTIPILLNTHFVIELWLGEVPKYVVIFSQLTLLAFFFEAIGGSLWMCILATGKITRYQIVLSSTIWFFFLLSWVLLKNGTTLYVVYWTRIIASFLIFIYRVYLLEHLVGLSQRLYYKKVFYKIILVSLLTLPLPLIIHFTIEDGFIKFIVSSLVFFMSFSLAIFKVGLEYEEKSFLYDRVYNLTDTIKRKKWVN